MSIQADILDILEGYPDVELAVLFGSEASGRARASSDVDIGVRLSPPSFERLADLEVDLGRRLRRSVDLVPLDRAPPLLCFEIARSGVLLRETRAHAWADFQARALVDWWDWAPTARWMTSARIAAAK